MLAGVGADASWHLGRVVPAGLEGLQFLLGLSASPQPGDSAARNKLSRPGWYPLVKYVEATVPYEKMGQLG